MAMTEARPVVLITGASGGVGKAVAAEMARCVRVVDETGGGKVRIIGANAVD